MKIMWRVSLAAGLVLMVSGCAVKKWEIRQLETTFVNQADNREYVQKSGVLFNSETGESWVFSSDENSHYYWEKIPVGVKDRTGK